MKVLQYKLSNGDEILTEVITSDKYFLTVKYPMEIEKIFSATGSSFYTMTPWLTQSSDELLLSRNHVMATTIPNENLVEQYYRTAEYLLNQQIDSNIDMSRFVEGNSTIN